MLQALTWIIVLVYTIVFNIYWKEGYKQFDSVNSHIRGSLKGAIKTNFNKIELDQLNNFDKVQALYNRVWDLTKNDDYAPEMEDSFFVPTNVFITPDQTLTECPDFNQKCKTDKDCRPSENQEWTSPQNSIKSGNCITSTEKQGKYCQVSGWCPLETNISLASSTMAILNNTSHLKIKIDNHVQFTEFNLDRQTDKAFTVEETVVEAITRLHCRKNCKKNCKKHCLGDYAQLVNSFKIRKEEKTDLTYKDIAIRGGIIDVHIHWSCYLGWTQTALFGELASAEDKCKDPTFKFILNPPFHKDDDPYWGFKNPFRKGIRCDKSTVLPNV